MRRRVRACAHGGGAPVESAAAAAAVRRRRGAPVRLEHELVDDDDLEALAVDGRLRLDAEVAVSTVSRPTVPTLGGDPEKGRRAPCRAATNRLSTLMLQGQGELSASQPRLGCGWRSRARAAAPGDTSCVCVSVHAEVWILGAGQTSSRRSREVAAVDAVAEDVEDAVLSHVEIVVRDAQVAVPSARRGAERRARSRKLPVTETSACGSRTSG